jgi:hypothetical protein
MLVVTGPKGFDAGAAAAAAGHDPEAGLLVAIEKPEPCEVTVRRIGEHGQ